MIVNDEAHESEAIQNTVCRIQDGFRSKVSMSCGTS